MITTIKPILSLTPDKIDSITHIIDLIEEACSFLGINTIYLSLYCPSTHDIHYSIKNYGTQKIRRKKFHYQKPKQSIDPDSEMTQMFGYD